MYSTCIAGAILWSIAYFPFIFSGKRTQFLWISPGGDISAVVDFYDTWVLKPRPSAARGVRDRVVGERPQTVGERWHAKAPAGLQDRIGKPPVKMNTVRARCVAD